MGVSEDSGKVSLISTESNSFERVGKQVRHKQRAMFESLVFTDTGAIVTYLDDLFSSKPAKEMLESRYATPSAPLVRSFVLSSTKLTTRDFELAVESLLEADLLSNEKRDKLKEISQNPTVLAEITDVLNMHMGSLTSWPWIPAPDG